MKKKTISLLIICIIALSALPLGFFTLALAKPTMVLPEYEPIDLGTDFRKSNVPIHGEFPLASSAAPRTASEIVPIDAKTMLTYDAYYGYVFFDLYYLVAVSDYTEIWIQADLSWPEGDPRNYPYISQEMIDYLLVEFDNIYDIDTAYFGMPDYHDGTYSLLEAWGYVPPGYYYSETGKNIIMVSNVRDDSYYDPTYPNYIAGFYWGTYEAYFDRNIINIDCHDWIHRVGPAEEGGQWVHGEDVTRPNLYESIIAHEYQHLIHADWFPGDETYMNEACSLFAEPLCGYELDLGQVVSFLATPDNSLTYWGEQGGPNILADYGAAFLWALYLTDHYGLDFMQRYVQANWEWDDVLGWVYVDFPTEPMTRITELLPDGVDFDQVFHDWRIANLIHADMCCHDKYNYHLEELRAFTGNENQYLEWEDETHPNYLAPLEVLEVDGKKIDWTSAAEEFGETIDLNGISTGYTELAPYSTDYLRFPDMRGLNFFKFDGDDTAVIPLDPYDTWAFDGEEWYSGSGDLLHGLLATQITNVAAGAELELYTYFDIEPFWDFGFVQVSTESELGFDSDLWTSLELDGVTTYDHDPGAHPDVVANLPGITGWSEDYVTLTFDLSAYEGMDIYIGFRYVTDWAEIFPGWVLGDVFVTGEGNIEERLAKVYPGYPDAEFMVSVVTEYSFFGHKFYSVYDMHLNSLEYGWTWTLDMKKTDTVFVISPVNDVGYVDYEFKYGRRFGKRWWC